MATVDIYLSGKGKYIRPYRPNDWNDYTCVLYPDAESLEKINKLKREGLKNVLSKDDDGYFMRFKCPSSKEIRGKRIEFSVEVVDKDNQPTNVMIGDGSDITLKLERYSYAPKGAAAGIATRWMKLRIDHLVPSDFKPPEQEQEPPVKAKQEDVF